MKCMRGAEAISIFKPTDTPFTSFFVWPVGVAGMRRRGEVFLLNLRHTAKASVWLRLWGEKKEAGWLVDVKKIANHGCCKQSLATAFPFSAHTFVLPLIRLYSTLLASWGNSLTDSGSLTLRGSQRSVGGGEMLSIHSSSCQLAAGVGTSHSPCRYWHLQQDCNNRQSPPFLHLHSWNQAAIPTRAWNKTDTHTYWALFPLSISLCSPLQRRGVFTATYKPWENNQAAAEALFHHTGAHQRLTCEIKCLSRHPFILPPSGFLIPFLHLLFLFCVAFIISCSRSPVAVFTVPSEKIRRLWNHGIEIR